MKTASLESGAVPPVSSAEAQALAESDEAVVLFFTPVPDAPASREEHVDAAPGAPAPAVIVTAAVDPARRRALRRYVATALAVASVIGVAAIVRGAVAYTTRETAAPPRASLRSVAPPVEEPRPVLPPPSPPPVAQPAPPPAEALPPPATASTAAPAAPPEQDPVAARESKKIAQRALDRGKTSEAVEAGERSVALDPTDGDAWLILGAAYQARGAASEARRCFSSCVRQGTRGARGECAALLR